MSKPVVTVEEECPVDEPLGNICGMAFALQLRGAHDAAMVLAKAHEKILVYVIRLQNAIDDAPHGEDCNFIPGFHPEAHAYRVCNCWKQAAR